jgi:hypothetical protein
MPSISGSRHCVRRRIGRSSELRQWHEFPENNELNIRPYDSVQPSREAVHVKIDPHVRSSTPPKIFWLRIAGFVFLVTLAVMVYLLAESMVHHRFHRGGWVNKHDVLKP